MFLDRRCALATLLEPQDQVRQDLFLLEAKASLTGDRAVVLAKELRIGAIALPLPFVQTFQLQ